MAEVGVVTDLYVKEKTDLYIEVEVELIKDKSNDREYHERKKSISSLIDGRIEMLQDLGESAENLSNIRSFFLEQSKKIELALSKHSAGLDILKTLGYVNPLLKGGWPTPKELVEIPNFAGFYGYTTGGFFINEGDVVWKFDNGNVSFFITKEEFFALGYF
jgi:hypothetical protein